MNLKFLITTTVSLIISMSLAAQNLTQTIRGKVIDEQSESPIIGANVIVQNTEPILGATTDINGDFRIDNVPIGRNHIKVSFIGYENTTLPELLITSGKETVLNIKLRESIIQMEEIVVTATEEEKGRPLNEMALISAQSFSVEETNRYAATFDDPARAALSLPGITGGGDDGTNEIVIRGNSPRGVLWRVEGIEVPNPNHFAEEGSSAGIVSMLSSSMLSNSDFFTGAFPAEYGNALSGVFDINLRQGNNEKREYAFQAGLLGLAFAAEGPFSKNPERKSNSSYLANYRYSTVDLIDKLGVDVIEEREQVTFQDFAFKLHFPSQKIGSISLWGIGGASKYVYEADENNNDFENEISRNNMAAFGLSHIYYLNNSTYLKTILSWSYNQTDYKEDSLGLRVNFNESFNYKALRASTLINHKFNARNTLRSGIILNHLNFELESEFFSRRSNSMITELDTDGGTQFLQGYSQWQHRLNELLTFNSGLHVNYFALNNNFSIEPRLGLRWQFLPTQAITTGFGIHSRLEPISLYLAQDPQITDQTVQPNKNLELTKAMHAIIGYENVLKPGLKIKSEIYYQYLYDVPIRLSNVTQPWEKSLSALNARDGFTSDTLVNNGTGRNYGIELTLEKSLTKNYYFMITGSLFESKYTAADNIERNTRFNGNFSTNITVGKEFKVGRSGNNWLGFNGRVIWGGGQRVVPIDLESSRNENRTIYDWSNIFNRKLPNYFRMDIGIQYRKNKPTHTSIIALNVQNFTGRYNVLGEYYNSNSDKIQTDEQLGLFPNLSYRIEF